MYVMVIRVILFLGLKDFGNEVVIGVLKIEDMSLI